jgi:hypothetical protein
MKKDCSKCGAEKETNREKQRYCKLCHNEWMRDNRKKHSELSEEQKKKANARSYFNTYLNRGLISKECCSVCENPIAEGHHEDYNKPLDVVWLCRECHLKHHKE